MAATPATSGDRFEVLIQGKVHPWSRDTITLPEIRELGGFPPGSDVVEEDYATGNERSLPEDYVHELVPLEAGKTVVKKVGFKHA